MNEVKKFDAKKYLKRIDGILLKMDSDINQANIESKRSNGVNFEFGSNAEFMVCLKLHKLLIRSATKEQHIEAALELFNGCFTGNSYIKSRAVILINALNNRHQMLSKWRVATNDEKIAIYSAGKKIPPKNGVFKAVFMVLDNGVRYGTAARKAGVNAASVKNLKVKIEQLDHYADLLHTINKKAVLSEGLLT